MPTSPATQHENYNIPGQNSIFTKALSGISGPVDEWASGKEDILSSSGETPSDTSPAKSKDDSEPTMKAGEGLYNPPVSPEESVENTPEADPNHPASYYDAQDNLRTYSNMLNEALTGKQQVTKVPTAQQNVNAALAPDEKQLAALPSDYGTAMASITPYLNGTSTGIPALDAADSAVSSTIESQTPGIEKALGGLSTAGKEYGNSVLYQAPLASAISNIKYQQEIGELSVAHDDWPSTMTSIYDYLTATGTAATGAGSGASSSGLPSPASAADQADSAQAQAADTLAGGGNG